MKFSTTLTLQYDTPFSAFRAEEWEASLMWASASGLDAVEICISHYNGVDIQQVSDQLAAHRLACSTISTGQSRIREGISLLASDKEAVRRAQQRLIEHIKAASILNSAVTLGLLRGVGTSEEQAEQKRSLAHAMQPILEVAEEHQVIILLEAINRYETALLNSASETKTFIIDYLQSNSQVRILWDLFHANIEDPSYAEAITTMGPLLGYVHMADSNRMFPGYGHTDFPQIIRLLKEADFSGYLSFECLNEPSLETVRSETKPFVAALRTMG